MINHYLTYGVIWLEHLAYRSALKDTSGVAGAQLCRERSSAMGHPASAIVPGLHCLSQPRKHLCPRCLPLVATPTHTPQGALQLEPGLVGALHLPVDHKRAPGVLCQKLEFDFTLLPRLSRIPGCRLFIHNVGYASDPGPSGPELLWPDS